MTVNPEKPHFPAKAEGAQPVGAFSGEALDLLMPMSVSVGETGHMLRAGPTLQKVFGETQLTGLRFLEVFELRRPAGITGMPGLRQNVARTLHLNFRNDKNSRFKALAVPYEGTDALLLNISFGISVVDAVRKYDLTSADFAATNLAVEMLYLVEAKTAVLNELRELNQRLQHARMAAEEQAATDALTGLRNRRAMDLVLARFVDRSEPFGLMHIDLDHFKNVNDSLGHAAGDHVLQRVAEVLKDETRAGDTVARAGGDEFVVLFPGLTDTRKLNDIARRVIDLLELPVKFEGKECRISASVGTTVSDFYRNPDADRMLADADAALYASKHRGRAQVTIWSECLTNPADNDNAKSVGQSGKPSC